MSLTSLPTQCPYENKTAIKLWQKNVDLLNDLATRDLPEELITDMNARTAEILSVTSYDNSFNNLLRKTYAKNLTVIRGKMNLVPQKYYTTLWIPLGMAGIGMPIGVAFGTLLDNMGLLGLGLPIGMVFGLILGSAMDRKAKEQGRQLNITQ